LTLLQILPNLSESQKPHQTRSHPTAAAIFRIFSKPFKMAEEVGFEPTLPPNENVNVFLFIGKLTLFRPVKVHIFALPGDHDFGGALFKFSFSHGGIGDLSPCAKFQF
jgi:hypothetical protein